MTYFGDICHSSSARLPEVLGFGIVLLVGGLCGGQALGQDAVEAGSVAAFAKGWSALFDSEPFTAANAVEKLTRSPNPGTRLQALHVKARSLWLAGDPASQRAAQRLWAQVAREGHGDPLASARTEIARSLGWVRDGHTSKAIEALETITKQGLLSAAIVEAAIELSLLYAESDRNRDAMALLDEADKVLAYPESINVPPELQKAFAKGVERARESIGNTGHRLFLLAKGMQRESQHARAIALFKQVIDEFPASDYSPQSEFEVGACLASIGRQVEAIEHWQKFVAAAPAGPWRGQAFLELVTIQLMGRLDLAEADRWALQAKSAIATVFRQTLTPTSGWGDAAPDLWFSIGIVALCGSSREAAAEAIAHARLLAPEKGTFERLAKLESLARGEHDLIPTDCRISALASGPPSTVDSERVELALSLGMIHHLTGHDSTAERCFRRVTGSAASATPKDLAARAAVRPLPAASPAQIAFAEFGKGLALSRQNKTKEAEAAFLAAVDASSKSAWRDEALYRLATIIESRSTRPIDRAIQIDRKHLAIRRGARLEALPYWRQIIEQFPESAWREVAMYRAACIAYEQAEAASESAIGSAAGGGDTKKRVERAWLNAATALRAFTDAYRESPRAGEAYVRQIDGALERQFDLQKALALGPPAAKWARVQMFRADAGSPPPWSGAPPPISEETLASMRRECLIRAALTAYLAERYDDAIEYVNAAGPEVPRQGFTFDSDIHAIGLHFLLKTIQTRKPVADPLAMDAAKTDSQRMALQLGGLYLAGIRPDRAEAVFRRIVEKEPMLGAIPVAVEAAATLELAIALDRQFGRQPEGVDVLQQLAARRDLHGTVWGGTALFRYALYTFNVHGDASRSLALYQRFLREYPTHPLRELASYYSLADACTLRDKTLAVRMADDFRKAYPTSKWLNSISKRLARLE